MNLVRYFSYPVYFDPDSEEASAYVMEHFYRIRSNARHRQLLKLLIRPVVPLCGRRGRDRLTDHPRFAMLIPRLKREKFEVVIDARRFFRLIDFNRREVISIFKGEDLPVYFHNEVTARKKLAGADFIPRLLSVDEANKTFVEEYVCTRPFKSVRRKEVDAVDLAARVEKILRRVREAGPSRVVTAEAYTADLAAMILARPEAGTAIRNYVRRLREKSLELGRVELVFSHGDLRKDQVFFSPDGSLKILDWECSGYFSRYFDPIQFILSERWLYRNPALPLSLLLETDSCRFEAIGCLYLLELCSFPIRFRRSFSLTRNVPVIQCVERQLRKYIWGRRN